MNVFEMASTLESDVEEELKNIYKERAEVFKSLYDILGSKKLKDLKSMLEAQEGGLDIKVVNDYTAELNKIIDYSKALKIYDRTIILLETGYDPEVNEEYVTDIEIPQFTEIEESMK